MNLSKTADPLYEGDKRSSLKHVDIILKSTVTLAIVADSVTKCIQEKKINVIIIGRERVG